MAFAGKIIFNQKSGQLIKFIRVSKDTEGKLLEMNATFPPKSDPPPLHYHPKQTECFRVISGTLTVNVRGNILILKQGEMLKIEPNIRHSMWNESTNKTIVNWQVRPALQTEYLLETLTGLANDNRTNALGLPTLLQRVITARKYQNSFILAKPAYYIQKILFAILTPIALLNGYRADDEKYFT